MQKFQLEIKLLTGSIIGSGTGFGSVIDHDVVLNDLGLPYIPAKRIKGCLRDSAIEVLAMLKLAGVTNLFNLTEEIKGNKDSGFEIINNIFGVPGSLNPAKLIVYNLQLPNSDESERWLPYLFQTFPEVFNAGAITDKYTSIRQQTALDDKGIAKRNSLRTFRLLDKGLVFCGCIETGLNEEELALLGLAANNLKYIGTKRNRGYGRVRCCIPGLKTQLNTVESKLEEIYNAQN